jgi:hypothetical protein
MRDVLTYFVGYCPPSAGVAILEIAQGAVEPYVRDPKNCLDGTPLRQNAQTAAGPAPSTMSSLKLTTTQMFSAYTTLVEVNCSAGNPIHETVYYTNADRPNRFKVVTSLSATGISVTAGDFRTKVCTFGN